MNDHEIKKLEYRKPLSQFSKIWRLEFIEFLENRDKELYNLKDDVGETRNLLPGAQEKADELQKMLESRKSEVLQ